MPAWSWLASILGCVVATPALFTHRFGRCVHFADGTVPFGAPKHQGSGTVREFLLPPT